MTIVLVVLGAALAALGTRAAALAFVAAAVAAGGAEVSVAVVGTWSAALAAGWLLLTTRSVRRLALPALGLAAVLVAGSVPNGAVVLGVWVIATCAAAAAAWASDGASPWSLALCALDLVLAACIASTMERGFEGWPQTVTAPAGGVLLAIACLRAPLAAGPDDETALPGLLVVRAQTMLLASFALAAPAVGLPETAAVVGAAMFGGAPLLGRRAVTDGVQEFGLVLLALASAELGWGPDGWAWGALAGGTLIHYLRFTVSRTRSAPFGRAISVSAGIGVPFLPIVLVQLEAAMAAPRLLSSVVLVGLLAGLAGRTRATLPAIRRSARRFDEARAGLAVGLAAVASLAAVVFTLPRPPAAAPAVAPPFWAAVAVLGVGIVGSRAVRVVGTARREPVVIRWPGAVTGTTRFLVGLATPRAVWAAVGTLAVVAAALWIAGASRGFL